VADRSESASGRAGSSWMIVGGAPLRTSGSRPKRDDEFWKDLTSVAQARAAYQGVLRKEPWLDKDDLAQEAVAAVLAKMADGGDIQNLRAYVNKVVDNKAKDANRKGETRLERFGEQVTPPDPKSEQDTDAFCQDTDAFYGASAGSEPSTALANMESFRKARAMIVDTLATYPTGPANALFSTPAQLAAVVLNEINAVTDPFDDDRRPIETPDGVPPAYWLAAPDIFDAGNKQDALYKRLQRARDKVDGFRLELGLGDPSGRAL
jgi:DNA-directed RNA polymerase specialized sigma24 family protein